jgi:hypothetical protein
MKSKNKKMVSGKKKAIHEGQPFVIISFFFAKELGGKSI